MNSLQITNVFSEKRPVLYIVGPKADYKHDGDSWDWVYLAMRWISAMKSTDRIVLQHNWVMAEYVSYLVACEFISQEQVFWAPSTSYMLEKCILGCPNIFLQLKKFVEEVNPFIAPYFGNTPEFLELIAHLKIDKTNCLMESNAWSAQFATKEWLHPWAFTSQTKSLAQTMDLPILKGYNASTSEELTFAYELLYKQGVRNFVIKPLSTAFGTGIVILKNISNIELKEIMTIYRFEFGPVMLEEFVEIDEDMFGELSWSTHYIGTELFGSPTRQVIKDRHSIGNFTSAFAPELSAILLHATQRILNTLKPVAMGGFNGPIVNGKPFVTDANTGRMTGVCSSLQFKGMYCLNNMTLNLKMASQPFGLTTLWERLKSEGLAFNKGTGTGIHIMSFIPSEKTQFLISASTQRELIIMHQQLKVICS